MTQSHVDYCVIAAEKIAKRLNTVDRAEKGSASGASPSFGHIRGVVSQLPKLDGVEKESVSSLLCAEVIHFLDPEEMRQALKRMFEVPLSLF